MSKVDGKKVSYAVAHGTLFIPNTHGQFGPTLTVGGTSKVNDMVVDEPFLLLTIKDTKGQDLCVPVPLTNFSHMVVDNSK